MKKNILVILFVLVNTNIFAQQATCKYVIPPDFHTKTGYSAQARAVNSEDENLVLNVKFHTVFGTNGENPYNITEAHFLKMIEVLNINFNQFKIFFKYRGFNFINDNNFLDQSTGEPLIPIKNKFISENLYDTNAINVFYVYGGTSGFAETGDVLISTFYNTLDLNYVTCHEFGHTLGLSHPHSTSLYSIVDNNLPSCITDYLTLPTSANYIASYTEHVTRDPTNPKYNANTHGDRVTDTAAAHFYFQKNYCTIQQNGFTVATTYNKDPRVVDNSGDINTTCYYCFSTQTKYSYTLGNNYYTTLFNGVETNILLNTNTWQNIIDNFLNNCAQVGSGEMYDLNNEVHNFMTGYSIYNHFTPGQGIKMRETILTTYNDTYSQKLNLNDDGSPDISVLYEPFSNYFNSINNGGVGMAYSRTYNTNTTNTGANVWNCGPFTLRFQPGFDYEFTNSSGQVTLQNVHQQYNAVSPNCLNIKIPILSQDTYSACEPVCFYTFEPFTSGDIKSSYSLGSPTYSQEELDKIKASDPNLYNELQSGKYHIITKTTDSGYSDQKVIYKN